MDNLNIDVFRGTNKVAELPLIAGVFTKRLMADHILVFNLKAPKLLDLAIGDKVVYKSETMKICKPLEPTRSHEFEYTITFSGWREQLKRWIFSHLDQRNFDYFGDLQDYLNLFVEKLNEFDSGWSVGELEVVEPFALNFDKVDFLTALTMICQACGCEWDMKEKEFTVKKTVGTAKNYPLAYGKGKGCYSIKRNNFQDRKIFNRVYCYGGSQNLPAGYKPKELTLPEILEDQESIDKYGLWEEKFTDDKIIPERTSTVVEVAQVLADRWSITDPTIDFDMQGLWIDGVEPKIFFKTGDLNQQEFKILSYIHATKTIVFESKKDSNGNLLPLGIIKPVTGDKYTILGIRMPPSYFLDALARLKTKGLEALQKGKTPRVVYQAPLDPLDMKRKQIILTAGDIVPMKDDDLGLDENLRITAVSYPACFPEYLVQGMIFTAEISQDVSYNWKQTVEKDLKQTKDVITQTTRISLEDARLQALRMRQLQNLVFDADNYFNPERIKPQSIETLMLSVGAKSQNFLLNGVAININNDNDPKKASITAGQLVHLEVEIEGIGSIWNISGIEKNDLISGKSYYVAARCSRYELTGNWVISETPIPTLSEVPYYYFNIGVIFPEVDGVRDYAFTNGMTYINGRQIKTGTIDADRLDVQAIVVNGGGATVSQMNTALADTLLASKAYAAAEDELSRVTMAAYADGKVTAEEQARIADAQAKLAAAKAYSDAQDDLNKTILEAYADGVVTAEEQARIADAQAKLQEAKTHANTVANSALESAKDYTNVKMEGLGGLAYSDLVELSKLGNTIIEGGYIKTTLLDVVALFAQQIVAENLKVTGNSSIGPFSIIQEGLYGGSNSLGGIARDQVSIRTDGLHLNFTDLVNGNKFSVIDMYGDDNVLAKMWNNGSTRKRTAHQYDMGVDGTAIDLISGDVRVEGVIAASEKVPFTSGGVTKYLNFRKGLFTGVTSS